MSNLPTNLIKEFVAITNDSKPEKKQTQFYGTASVEADGIYVILDGSENHTPVSMATDAQTGDRVLVEIVNHSARIIQTIDKSASDNVADRIQNDDTGVFKELRIAKEYVDTLVAGDITADSIVADRADIKDLKADYAEIDDIVSDNISAEQLTTINAAINNLKVIAASFKNISVEDLEAVNARIETIEAKYADLESISATDADIINAEIDNLTVLIGEFTDLSADELHAFNAEIENLKAVNAEFSYVSAEQLQAIKANIKQLDVDKLSVKDADVKYANIDFSNIGKAAMEYFYAKSGLIENVIVGDQTITGKLIGVTISGELIEGNTIKAEKLVVKGEDGLYYKLNIEGGSTTTEEITKEDLQNGLDGRNIIAKTITATQISVSDLVAFGATIGGFNIGNNSIYSGVKSSVNNTTRGIYLDSEGQFSFGDGDNYIKYYQDGTVWRLKIAANSVWIGTSGKTVEETIDDMKTEMETMKDEITTNLRIESSRGTVFKNNSVSTVLSAVIYRGSQRITDIATLKSAMGLSAYLQWSWQRLDETEYGVISATDSRIGNDGFTFTLSPDDVDTKVTFMCELII